VEIPVVRKVKVMGMIHQIDRSWFLTWTTYGTWLPGDARGSVSDVRNDLGMKVRQNAPGERSSEYRPSLANYARDRMNEDAVWLDRSHAEQLFDQFVETAAFRKWTLFAVAIMANHIHVVMGVLDDPAPDDLKKDIKAYASRRLNRQFGPRPHRTWWTEGGSARKLDDEASIREAVRYVRGQEFPLLLWIHPEVEEWLNDAIGGERPT
jgi:REP element-mobilizing transposase RayT